MEKYRIFVSHSLNDKEKIKSMKIFSNENLDCYFAEESYRSNITISEKIANEINSRDYFFLILTEKSKKSPFVNQEFGYAKAKNKKIVIIKESKKIKQEGFLYGYDCLVADEDFNMEKIMNILNADTTVVKTLPQASIDKIAKNNDYLVLQNNVITYRKEDNSKDLIIAALGATLICLLIVLVAKKS